VILPELHDASPGVDLAHAAIIRQLMSLPELRAASESLASVNPASVKTAVPDADPEPQASPALSQLDMHDVLVAYLILLRSDLRAAASGENLELRKAKVRQNARRIVGNTFAMGSNSMSQVVAFVDVALDYPDDASTLAATISSSRPVWPIEVGDTDDLGRLTRELYDATQVSSELSRTDYLSRRLCSGRNLSEDQRTFAAVLCPEWAGTLEELVLTVTTLRPVH
jgi:hypothetical protein